MTEIEPYSGATAGASRARVSARPHHAHSDAVGTVGTSVALASRIGSRSVQKKKGEHVLPFRARRGLSGFTRVPAYPVWHRFKRFRRCIGSCAASHLSPSPSGRPAARTQHETSMNVMKEGWFTEIVNTNNNPVLSVDVEKVLHQERSNFQDILVFKSKSFGTVLALDNAIQCTERDEFSYQEMITFLPLNCHPDPKDVLIIGGGDGGVAREVVKHPSVVSVTQCEIDEKVVEVSKKYLPFMAEGFNSPKLELKIGDGFQFIKETTRKFDVVITDSSDPIGPAEALFQKPYYEGLKRILKPGGIICSQGESMWFDLKLIEEMMDMCRSLFPVVNYASIYTPTYPSGQIGFLLCSTLPDTDFHNPVHKFTEEQLRSMKIRYYSPEVHQAALALPRFVKQTLYK